MNFFHIKNQNFPTGDKSLIKSRSVFLVSEAALQLSETIASILLNSKLRKLFIHESYVKGLLERLFTKKSFQRIQNKFCFFFSSFMLFWMPRDNLIFYYKYTKNATTVEIH